MDTSNNNNTESILDQLKKMSKDDYDDIPVYYCSRCLSLKIKADIPGYDYCDECNSTNIDSCSIDEWERLYKARFGHGYLEGFYKNSWRFKKKNC